MQETLGSLGCMTRSFLSPPNTTELRPGMIAACHKAVSEGNWKSDVPAVSELHPAIGFARSF